MAEENGTVWFTLKQAAAYLNVSYGRLAEKVRNGDIPAEKVPGFTRSKRIKKAELDRLMEARGGPSS